MTLWDWAVRAYRSPDVERLCLDLQDRDAQCVCLLLWAAWAAREGRDISETLPHAVSAAKAWEEQAIGPLRAARRGLKAAAPGIDDSRREDLRAQARALELAAERLLLDALEAGTPAPAAAAPSGDLASALVQTAEVWNGAAPERFAALAAAFSRS